MKIRNIKKVKSVEFISNYPLDYIDLYNRTNLNQKGVSLDNALPILKMLRYNEFKRFKILRWLKTQKMNHRQLKKFWSTRGN